MNELLKKRWFAVPGAVICTALWGTAYPVIKYSYAVLAIESTADKLMFAGARFFAAGMMVFAAAWIKGRRIPSIPKRLIGPAVLYGALQTGLMYILNYIGVANTTAAKTSALTAASAFLAVVFAPLFFKDERLTALKIAGVVIGLSGIVAVSLGDWGGGFALTGEGFVLAAAVLNTAGSFVGKRISKGRVFEMTAYQLLIGAALIIAAGLVMGGGLRLSAPAILLTLYLAFVSAAAFTLWTALLVRHEAGHILVFNIFIPIFGAIWSFIILGERQIFDPVYLLSVALISAGVILVNINKKS